MQKRGLTGASYTTHNLNRHEHSTLENQSTINLIGAATLKNSPGSGERDHTGYEITLFCVLKKKLLKQYIPLATFVALQVFKALDP